MSATQVIELYDALPAQEQRIVAEHIGKDATAQMSEQSHRQNLRSW